MSFYSLLRPFLFFFSAESAHTLALKALAKGAYPCINPPSVSDVLAMDLWGLHFPNPVGLAAGFDKNAEAYAALLGHGFGSVEVGTVTPRPQEGNPKPRLFRLEQDRAIINRMGFNNGGLPQALPNLEARTKGLGIVGVNIGKNKGTEQAVDDYLYMLDAVYPLADYIAVNISSPNTKGLRDLQRKSALASLMRAVYAGRDRLAVVHGYKAVLIKIAPDIDSTMRRDIAEVALELEVDGLIISNTTVARPLSLKSNDAQKNEMGGLSGVPLMQSSTEVLADIYRLTQGNIPLVGVGGIASAEDAIAKIRAGASLVQLYSALVYEGLGLVERINQGIAAHLAQQGMNHLSELVGADVGL